MPWVVMVYFFDHPIPRYYNILRMDELADYHIEHYLYTMTEQLKAFWKKLISYRKEEWDINDYPLRYRRQADIPAQYNVGELKI